MAAATGRSSSRSVGLEIAIFVLIAILLVAILYPKRLWNEQNSEEALCRDRMENLFYASQFYHKTTRTFTTDVGELMAFAERESVTILPAGFKMDRLTREDTGIDSFQVEYYDPYQYFSHYEKAVRIEYPSGQDSVVLSLVPKKAYPFVPITKYCFASDKPITAISDDRGDQGVFTLVGSQGRLRGTQILGVQTEAKAADYIYFVESQGIEKCPTSESAYKVGVNVKINILADIKAALEKTRPEKPVSDSRTVSSIVVFRLLKEADAASKRQMTEELILEGIEDSLLDLREKAFLDSIASGLKAQGKTELSIAVYDSTLDQHPLSSPEDQKRWDDLREATYTFLNDIKADSVFINLRDDIVNARKAVIVERKFGEGINRLFGDKRFTIDETGIITTTADSVEFYSRPELVRDRLIHERTDSVTVGYMNRPDVQELLGKFSYEESYQVSRVDSSGLTISCPIEGTYKKPNPSLLARIFSVSGAKNHGRVHNGDLSWSERR